MEEVASVILTQNKVRLLTSTQFCQGPFHLIFTQGEISRKMRQNYNTTTGAVQTQNSGFYGKQWVVIQFKQFIQTTNRVTKRNRPHWQPLDEIRKLNS